jgi:two-component system phosphate regulon sensor histidine kinase PhoR
MTLIDNAIKHNRPKTKIMAEIDSSDEGATIRISDNGDGMKPENLSRIFDIGVREGGAGAPAGSGMGLHIAKLLTELQGGDISVESKLGQGSVFTVKLPIAS